MHNPSDAKKLGRDLTLRPDWEKVKVRLMYEICMCKFMQNPELRDKLLATGESTLIEGNNWGDYFWESGADRSADCFCRISSYQFLVYPIR